MKARQPVPMAARLLSLMDKRFCSSGFTLPEMLLVLLLTSALMLISIPLCHHATQTPRSIVVEEIVTEQFNAIMENEYRYVEREDICIRFNRIGNVNQANHFEINGHYYIVSLGTGRIYEDD